MSAGLMWNHLEKRSLHEEDAHLEEASEEDDEGGDSIGTSLGGLSLNTNAACMHLNAAMFHAQSPPVQFRRGPSIRADVLY
jgi:hypothetical protein